MKLNWKRLLAIPSSVVGGLSLGTCSGALWALTGSSFFFHVQLPNSWELFAENIYFLSIPEQNI